MAHEDPMVTAAHKAASGGQTSSTSRRPPDIAFYSPIGIQAVAAATAQLRRSQREEALRAESCPKEEPAVLRNKDDEVA